MSNEWKRLADVTPARGQLVEYRGVNPECARKDYATIDTIPTKGNFVRDCGTNWNERLDGFTTKVLGVIVAPDPRITFWRPIMEPFITENSGPIPPGVKAEMPSIVFGEPDTGIKIDEPNYTIIEEGKQVGKFWFDEETKRFKFEGDMEASAQIFMELVLRTLNQEKVK